MAKAEPPRPGTSDIEISSGAFLNLADPDPSVITIDVISHHLAKVCRYACAVKRMYSVGEHALLVAAYLEFHEHEPRVILSGLHHDDAEAFVGDMTRPLKELLPEFKVIEDRLAEAVDRALGFGELGIQIYDPTVKEADVWAMAAEAYYLMPTGGREWWSRYLFDPSAPVANMREVLQLADNEPYDIKSQWKWRHIDLLRALHVSETA